MNFVIKFLETINSFLFIDEELDNEDTVTMKFIQELITFVLEDFVEVGLQFFYFEKYSFQPDNTIYVNALFMIIKALELTVRMIIMMKEDWNNDSKESF